VRLRAASPIDLTYCTNIHAATGWVEVRDRLRRFAPALKARLAPAAPFGIGLRLSAREARELDDTALRDFRAWLDDAGLYVAVINGFPYGPFHGTPMKAGVYAPDWRDPARVEYTLDLVRILAALRPAGSDGGISTAPISYKAWMPHPTADDWALVTANLARVADALGRAGRDRGVHLHLDIEPEPDCVLETTTETVAFFRDRLWTQGAATLARLSGAHADAAAEALRGHVQVCFDCCHVSVEHEDPVGAIRQLTAAGIGIGRVQLSSALSVTMPPDERAARTVADQLRPFADATYLHQVVCRHGTALRHAPDLGDALGDRMAGDWRIHFHVPLFTAAYGTLGSTQDDVRRVIREAQASAFTAHLEIETYTWDVLPADLKLDVAESIAREYAWVLEAWDEAAGDA
jgi:sugar phosphate isomerase/epimerase